MSSANQSDISANETKEPLYANLVHQYAPHQVRSSFYFDPLLHPLLHPFRPLSYSEPITPVPYPFFVSFE